MWRIPFVEAVGRLRTHLNGLAIQGRKPRIVRVETIGADTFTGMETTIRWADGTEAALWRVT
jgi:hypothetical protein